MRSIGLTPTGLPKMSDHNIDKIKYPVAADAFVADDELDRVNLPIKEKHCEIVEVGRQKCTEQSE